MLRYVVLLACGCLAVGARGEGELRLKDVFAATATATTVPRYRLGLDVLFAAGDRSLRPARTHATDPDPRKRALAGLIRLRHERPEQFAVWQDALRAPWIKVTTTVAKPPQAIVRFSRRGSRGQHLEWREVTFWSGCEPVLIDALRTERWKNAATIAGAMRSADTIPFLVRKMATEWDSRKSKVVEDALVAIGADTALAVRAALTQETVGGAAAAARVLGRLADPGSTEALLKTVAASDNEDVFSAAAHALRSIAPKRAAAVLLDRLLRATSIAGRLPTDALSYSVIRTAIMPFGAALRAEIKRRGVNANVAHATLLSGISWELADSARARAAYIEASARVPLIRFPTPRTPEQRGRVGFWWRGAAGPPALVAERAAAWGEPNDLVQLLATDPKRGVEIARIALLGRYRHHHGADMFWALAARAPTAARAIAEKVFDDRPPNAIDRYVEALLLTLDQPRTRALLRGVVARNKSPHYSKAVPIAQAALTAIRTEHPLATLLRHERPGVALAAARALARRGDSAGVPVLLKAALAARGYTYAALRREIVRAGVVPTAPAQDNLFHRVLRAAVSFRIKHPDRARAIDVELADPNPGIPQSRGGDPIPGQSAGLYLAGKLGKDARPLLEEAALFGGNMGAVQALGFLDLVESIPVLIRVARKAPFAAAHALRNLGPKGLAVAKTIPMPDPRRADYRGRAYRHVAAADALVSKDGGVEKALEGLAEAPPDGDRAAWAKRMGAYLTMGVRARGDTRAGGAGGSSAPDRRFLEPVLKLVTEHGDALPALRWPALELLAGFRDERIASIAVRWLPQRRFDSDGQIAANTLYRVLGERVVPFLRDRLRAAGERPPARLVHMLWRHVQLKSATREDRDHCARVLREACAAGDERAADELLILHYERPEDERAAPDLATVLDFIRARAVAGQAVLTIPKYKPAGAGEALLASYRLGHHHAPLRALGGIGYEPAADDVLAEWKLVVAGKKRSQFSIEIQALARLGATGRRMTLEYLKPTYDVSIRLSAAGALVPVGATEAYPAVLALWNELEAVRTKKGRKQHGQAVWMATKLDPHRAYQVALRRSFRGPERLRDLYAGVAQSLRDKYPELARKLPTLADR